MTRLIELPGVRRSFGRSHARAPEHGEARQCPSAVFSGWLNSQPQRIRIWVCAFCEGRILWMVLKGHHKENHHAGKSPKRRIPNIILRNLEPPCGRGSSQPTSEACLERGAESPGHAFLQGNCGGQGLVNLVHCAFVRSQADSRFLA